MKKIRFGVVGCGAISTERHLPALKKSKKAELVAVMDTDAEQLRRVSQVFGVRHAFQEFEQLVGLVDAVIVATPNATHHSITKMLLEHSIHVLCDKPLAFTLPQATELFTLAAVQKRQLTVSYNLRFSSCVQMLKKVVQEISSPLTMELSLGGDVTQWPARSNFRLDRSRAGGGCIIDTGIHILDMAIYFLGSQPTIKESKIVSLQNFGVEDNAFFALQFPLGSRASLSCSYTFGLKPKINIAWEDGWARTRLLGEDHTVFWFTNDSLACRSTGIQELVAEPNDQYMDQVDHFCDCILNGDTPMISREEVLAGHAVLDQLYAQEAE